METIYFDKKSDLTICKYLLEKINFNVYRTRTTCNCNNGTRDAIICFNKNDESYNCMVLRCKLCKRTKGGSI